MTVEIDRETPIKEDTVATLEFQGLTGIAYVQLRGGTQASARLDPNAADAAAHPLAPLGPGAGIRTPRPSCWRRRVAVVERLNLLLTDENLKAVAGTLQQRGDS